MELAALQSIVSDRCNEPIGLLIPTLSPCFQRTSWYFTVRRPPPLSQWVHPLVSFVSPSEFSSPYPPGTSQYRAPSLGFVPLRDINQRSPLTRASQARFVPSTEFLTPSTAYSSAGLAGLFHPAATSGLHSPGGFPPTQPHHLSMAVSLLPFDRNPYHPLAQIAPELRPRLQGFAPYRDPLCYVGG